MGFVKRSVVIQRQLHVGMVVIRIGHAHVHGVLRLTRECVFVGIGVVCIKRLLLFKHFTAVLGVRIGNRCTRIEPLNIL